MDMTEDSHIDNIRAIAELKTQVANVASDVSTIVEKIDIIFSLQREMARIEQEQNDHRDSIKRAFDRIEKGEGANSTLKETTDRWINRGLGGWFVGALLVGVIQWLIVDRVKTYEVTQLGHSQMMVTVDRRLSWIEYELKSKNRKEPPQ